MSHVVMYNNSVKNILKGRDDDKNVCYYFGLGNLDNLEKRES